ncbi:MAG: hypothetical protein D3923_09600, partial [Candidatus Electrothrix sp. AR3]|nr:hypothetical protein [Candidatus Electrothrix sp. AR3]
MSRQVSSINNILLTTWNLYKRRALPIFVVSLLAVFFAVFLLLTVGFTAASSIPGIDLNELERLVRAGEMQEILASPIWAAAGLLFFFTAALLGCWCQAAILVVAIEEEIGIFDALCAGWKYLFPLLWVTSLYTGIVVSGLSLLLLPGLILSLSLSLCFYIMIAEDLPGIEAVLVSRLYMRGHWWNTLFKFLLIWIISILLNLIPLLGPYLALLFYPFTLLYTVAVYQDLKQTAGHNNIPLYFSFKWCWVLGAAVGLMLPLLGFIGIAVTIGPQLPEKTEQIMGKLMQKNDAKNSDMDVPAPPSVRQLPALDGLFVWRDPVGDTSDPLLDIREVSARGEQGELLLAITLAQSFAAYFTASASKERIEEETLLSFYLDTDLKSATGALLVDGAEERRGYDLELEVVLHAIPGRAAVQLYHLDGSQRQPLGVLDQTQLFLAGSTLQIRLPYTQINTVQDRTV